MNSRKEKLLFSIIIVLCFALSGTIYINSQKPSEILLQDGEHEKTENDGEENDIPQEASKIGVHIAGQVKQPGFIWVKEGTRLGEALSYVGGALAEADLDAVNLSKKLMDEEKVYIPKIGETIQGTASESSSSQAGSLNDGKININIAGASELDSLPGIGEAYAKRIIEYREANGPFKSIEDIKNVTGIGEKRYEAIKDLIMVK
ncbi:helix-hairpin-helix domain-containing protein [Lutispora saccharofermentans]|uniref:Helix-hairpin-helix domain-containing protein n=1 Tax=Lutispora saccharofermentans TaxID=3024236 RepID=A0ABT1NGG3_9FIRM|nr:helix-hairpin-helix domain-containing protein [Lutispora saccharofermentans]MCQ1530317.1 helix-hairpin-helix domain-containing protein [Lutispora saccharofermentans]